MDDTCRSPQPPRLLVIGVTADDLTGAADTAAALARPGRPVFVSLGLSPHVLAGPHAFAVNTASRSCLPDQAYHLTRQSVEELLDAGANLIYKKTDSNLRGNVGPELAAVADLLQRPVLFCPAFPARRRTVVDAVAAIDGIPVAQTEMAHDPEAPVMRSHILELIQAQWPRSSVSHCPLAVVREGPEAIRRRLPETGLLVVDADTDEDLDTIGQTALSLPPLPAVAGSAGLAGAVADTMFGPREPMGLAGDEEGPVLAVLASSSAALQAQVSRVAGLPHLSTVMLPCEDLSRDEGPMPEVHQAAAKALQGLAAGDDVLVYATGPLPRVEQPVALVVEHLAHLAFVVVKEAQPRGLLLGGGAAAQGVLEALQVQAIAVDDEPQPGLAAGVLIGGEAAGRPVVLKPGAAGHDHVLAELLHYLHHRAAAGGISP